MRLGRKGGLLALVWAGAMLPAVGKPGDRVALPNPGFEEAAPTEAGMKQGFVTAEGSEFAGLPVGWARYQWGEDGSRYRVAVERGAGRSGSSALRAENLDPAARAGVFTHAQLSAGTYRLSVWARAPRGQKARVSVYLASSYSRPMGVTDRWTRLSFENTLTHPSERAEINVQNSSSRSSVVWLDDIALEEVAPVRYELVADTRKHRPRTLMFGPMNAAYLMETAAQWAAWGFRGFLFEGVMSSWPTDVWASDGDPQSRGEDDALLKQIRACNELCRRHGIDSNFVKVAFYDDLPDPFDDAAWVKVVENFRQGARFARMSGCAGMAIDTEYVAHQYSPDWKGYATSRRSAAELKARIQERWRTVTAAMLKEYPDMVLLTLPEGMLYYGELYMGIFMGMLQACAEARAPGGLHVMTEGTYHLTSAAALASYPERVTSFIQEECPKPLRDYWRKRCSVALGVWPLGYYRPIYDEAGKFLGWAGKKEVYGDQIIGSYADKSEWYPPSDFREQMAGVNTFSPRYNWVYSHGAVFWQWTEEQVRRYQQGAHKVVHNAALPAVSNLNEYLEAIAHPMHVRIRRR